MDVRGLRGSPDLSKRQAFVRAMNVVHRLRNLPTLKRTLDANKPGRPVELPMEAFLVAALYHALLHPKEGMHLTKVSNDVLQMGPSMKWQLGLTSNCTYRKIHLNFTRLVHILNNSQHNHPTVDHETGEVLRCPDDCPHRALNAHEFLNQFLEASCYPDPPRTTDYAIDGTAYDTWARVLFIRRGGVVDQAPYAKTPVGAQENDQEDTTGRRAARTTAKSGGYIQHTKDPDAREGYRTGSDNEPGRTFWGYEIHSVTNISTDKSVMPHLIRSGAIAPAGSDTRASAGLKSLDSLIDARRAANASQPPVQDLIADRGYSMLTAPKWQLPLWEKGVRQVFDLSEDQRGIHPSPIDRTVSIDGGFFVDALPERLRKLPRPNEPGLSKEKREAICADYDKRLAYALSPNSAINLTTGTQRFKGPARTGKLRCRNNKKSLRGPHSQPLTACKPGCACSKSFTLGPEDQARERQWPLYGTTAWFKSYSRRNATESINAEIKTHRANFKRGYTRVFELTKTTVLLAFGLAAVNIRILRDWHFKRGDQDPWAGPQEEQWDFEIATRKMRTPRRQKLQYLTRRRPATADRSATTD